MPRQTRTPRTQLSAVAEGALRAAAEELEGRVERGDGLALLEAEDQAAPDEQAAEGDDERRDAAVGDEEALEAADRGADARCRAGAR